MCRIALFSLGLCMLPVLANASCLDDVNALAKRYEIHAALPKDTASGSDLSGKLANSGGVIAPPATGDLSGATPAVPSADSMQTAPSVPEQGAFSGGKAAKTPDTQASASNAQVASLLQAARDASKNGNEHACQQRLSDAMKLLSNGSVSQ